MSSVNDSPDIQGLLGLFTPVQSDELTLLGFEDDLFELDKLESRTPCNDHDDTEFWLTLGELVAHMDVSQWEINGKVSTKILKSLSLPFLDRFAITCLCSSYHLPY